MPASVAPPDVPTPGASRRVSHKELWRAFKWGIGYEVVVGAASIALGPLLAAHTHSLLSRLIAGLLGTLLLPATFITSMAGGSPPRSWGAAVGLLLGLLALNVAVASAVALFVIHQRARKRNT